jgi:hypothetical protein
MLNAILKTKEELIVGRVLRADGTVSDPQILSYRHTNPLKTLRFRLRQRRGPVPALQQPDGRWTL